MTTLPRAEPLTRKLAREWFKAHPVCRITFHWRRDEIKGVNRELMDAKRTATVTGNRIKFAVALSGGEHYSEMLLDGLTSADISTGNLLIEFGPGRHIEYTPISGA